MISIARREKTVVAQLNDCFFLEIQPFIYHYLMRLKNFRSVYFAETFRDLENFRMPSRDCYPLPFSAPKRYSLPWLYDGLRRRVFGGIASGSERILRRRRVRLIHAHFGPRGYEALRLRGSLPLPVITSFYGYDVSRYAQQPEWRDKYKLLFEHGALFLVEGEFMKSRLVALGAPPDKVQIQRIAIPLSETPYRPRTPKKRNDVPIFLFCGRLVEKKGVLYALKTLERVRRQGKAFEFRIVGDGVMKPDIEMFIRDHRLNDCVRMLGELNHRAYLEEMSRADIYLHHSITAGDGNSEGGAPTTILEAQAMGLPVVSTLHADIPNVVVPGRSALLSPERDCEAMAENITRLIEHQEMWEEMGRVGREFIEKYHDIEKELNTLEAHYRSVLTD